MVPLVARAGVEDFEVLDIHVVMIFFFHTFLQVLNVCVDLDAISDMEDFTPWRFSLA